jgi:hypothetical protein
MKDNANLSMGILRERMIRFTDGDGKEFLSVPDGGFITITKKNGNQIICKCLAGNDTSFRLNHRLGTEEDLSYFADFMRNGGTVEYCAEPEEFCPDTNRHERYTIIERRPVGDKVFALGYMDNNSSLGRYPDFVVLEGYIDKMDKSHIYALESAVGYMSQISAQSDLDSRVEIEKEIQKKPVNQKVDGKTR